MSTVKHQKEVSHWIHDEQACVTVQRIAQTFNLSWSDASALLKQVPLEGKAYSVTSFGRGGSSEEDSGKNDASANGEYQLCIQ